MSLVRHAASKHPESHIARAKYEGPDLHLDLHLVDAAEMLETAKTTD